MYRRPWVTSSRLKILTFSNIFPTPQDPGHGIFVRSRVLHMAKLADIHVVAPVPILDYSHPSGKILEALEVPRHRTDAGLSVDHPLWWYPPRSTAINGYLLAWSMGRRF